MAKKEKTPYGYIYRATNRINEKNYIGKTDTSTWKKGQNPVEERWKMEVNKAKYRERRGERLRYIENAIIKYGEENFELVKLDKAHSEEELNQKEKYWVAEYDSMNPEKGYNMTEGGDGGKLSPEGMEKLLESLNDPTYKENMSKVIKAKYDKDPDYAEKQAKERRERAKDPEWIKKMTEINREKGNDPNFRENVSKAIKKKYDKDPEYAKKQTRERRERAKDPEWIKKMTEINRARAKDPEWLAKMREINSKYRKEITDKHQFLKDIQEMKKKEINEKYKMDGKTVNRRIGEILGPNGVKNYKEAKEYLKEKNIDDVVKDIESRSAENQTESQSSDDNSKGSEEVQNEESKDKSKEIKHSEEGKKESTDEKTEDSTKEQDKEQKLEINISTKGTEQEKLANIVKEINDSKAKREDIRNGFVDNWDHLIDKKDMVKNDWERPEATQQAERKDYDGIIKDSFTYSSKVNKDYEGIDENLNNEGRLVEARKDFDEDIFIESYNGSKESKRDYAGIDDIHGEDRMDIQEEYKREEKATGGKEGMRGG